MNFVGRWVFHSIGQMNENGEMVYMSEEDFINSPMPYVDETDPDAVADEKMERKQMVGGQIDICADGKLYLLLPVPEGVSQEEVDAAVASGEITLYDGMLTDEPKNWEDRDGEFWIEVGPDMSEDGWAQLSVEDGLLTFMTTRYKMAE